LLDELAGARPEGDGVVVVEPAVDRAGDALWA